MRKVFKGINVILTVSLIIVAVAIAFVALPIFGNQALIVRSGSMEPTIGVGSIVVVRGVGSAFVSPISFGTPRYREGDTIAFKSENNAKTIITHRITSVETNENGVFYKTKGDANKTVDGWSVSQENVLGKVYFTLPQFGKLLAFAKTDKGFTSLIIFPALFVMALEIFNIVKEIRKNRKKLSDEPPSEPRPSIISYINNWARLKILIPFLAIGLIMIPTSLAFYADTEISQENIFQASAVFPQGEEVVNTPTPTPTGEPTPGKIVINEVSPVGNALADWVELFNSGGSPVDITGWKVQDNTSTDVFPGTITIPAGEYAVIVASGSGVVVPGSAQKIELTSVNIGNALNEAGDLVRLLSDTDVAIDAMSYGSNTTIFTLPAPTSVQTMRRIPNGTDTDVAGDWQAGSSSIGVSN